MIRVTVYNEFYHEKQDGSAKARYPGGIHEAIADFLREEGDITVRTVTLDMPECGLTEEVLADTDVLLWWGHMRHHLVPDEVAERVQKHVLAGMGLIPLHSGHHSKPFRRLMGTSCNLHWREGDRERVWTVAPGHPIAAGIPEYFELEQEEMYGEPFGIPEPDETVFLGWFAGGETFRSGVTFHRENGRIFYFQPGHEDYPSFHNPYVQRIIKNAVRWAYNPYRKAIPCPWAPSPEEKRKEALAAEKS